MKKVISVVILVNAFLCEFEFRRTGCLVKMENWRIEEWKILKHTESSTSMFQDFQKQNKRGQGVDNYTTKVFSDL